MKICSMISILIAVEVAFAAEPSDYPRLQVPEGAVQVEEGRIAIPLAHKAKSALFLYENSRAGKLFCELQPDQASDFAGAEYKAIEGLKPILIKWSFMEPADEKGLGSVVAHRPSVYIKDGILFVSSSGIDIGNVGKVAEGGLIVQVETNPDKIVFKLSKTGW